MKRSAKEIRSEIARRFPDRGVHGFWGVNARAWIRLLIRDLRCLEASGCRRHDSGRTIFAP